MHKEREYEASLPKRLDVEEISNSSSDEENNIVYGGVVEGWETPEFSERKKARPYLTGIVITVWAVSVIASAFRLAITGDFLLAIPPALISAPACIVLNFYFKGG